jgi:hypothetical protein
MLVMRTTKHPAHPICKLVCSKQPLWLDDLALGVDPLGLYGVKPRTLLGQKAAHDPHSISALFDLTVMFPEPSPHLLGDVPGSVVPDENQSFLANLFELLQAPRKELGRYGTEGSAIYESQPRLLKTRQVEPVTADGLW